jgi:hypothetical protein
LQYLWKPKLFSSSQTYFSKLGQIVELCHVGVLEVVGF